MYEFVGHPDQTPCAKFQVCRSIFEKSSGHPTAAFKILELGKIEFVQDAVEGTSNAEKTRAEFETVSKLSHPNILKVLHVFRHQKTKKQNNIRTLENRTVIVMEKHDKNIGEITTEERIYLPDLLQNVLGQVQFIYI